MIAQSVGHYRNYALGFDYFVRAGICLQVAFFDIIFLDC